MSEKETIPLLKKTETNKRGNNKLLYLLMTLFVTVLIILFFRSSLSKVDQIQITGTQLVSVNDVKQAARVNPGDSFFFVSSSMIVRNVEKLKPIKSVKITKRFPGIIHIAIAEYPRVAFQINPDGSKDALLADGSAVNISGLSIPLDKPILSGWKDHDLIKTKLCVVLAQIPALMLSDISEIVPNPSAAYVDKIKMYTRSNFEVETTVGLLLKNIPYLSSMINEMKDNENVNSGIISLLDSPYGKPFDSNQAGTATTSSPKPAPTLAPTPAPTPIKNPVITSKPKADVNVGSG